MQRWFDVRNDSGEEIPAFGCVRLGEPVEVTRDGRTSVVYPANKPNTYGSQYSHAIAGPVPIAAGSGSSVKYGRVTMDWPTWALYDTGSSPAFGQSWGPLDDSWELNPHVGGFVIHGLATNGRVLVAQSPMLFAYLKADADVDLGNTGTFSIHDGIPGSESDSGDNFTGVINRYNDISQNDFVTAKFNQHNQTWEVITQTFVDPPTTYDLVLGKADGNIAADSTGTVSVWSGTLGSETDSTDNITAFNSSNVQIDAGSWVLCDQNEDGYYIVFASVCS